MKYYSVGVSTNSVTLISNFVKTSPLVQRLKEETQRDSKRMLLEEILILYFPAFQYVEGGFGSG
jgi:hypothetical protein